jgi:hypothetical protein
MHTCMCIVVKRSWRDYLVITATEVLVITDGIVRVPSGWLQPLVCTVLPIWHAKVSFHSNLYKHRVEKWSLNEPTNKPWPLTTWPPSKRQFVCPGHSSSKHRHPVRRLHQHWMMLRKIVVVEENIHTKFHFLMTIRFWWADIQICQGNRLSFFFSVLLFLEKSVVNSILIAT